MEKDTNKALKLAKDIMKDMQSAMKLLKVIRKHIGEGDFKNWHGKFVAVKTGKTLQQWREENKASFVLKGFKPLFQGKVQDVELSEQSKQYIAGLAFVASQKDTGRFQ